MLGLTARPAGLQLLVACCCRSASCVRVPMWCEFGGAGSIFATCWIWKSGRAHIVSMDLPPRRRRQLPRKGRGTTVAKCGARARGCCCLYCLCSSTKLVRVLVLMALPVSIAHILGCPLRGCQQHEQQRKHRALVTDARLSPPVNLQVWAFS